MLITLNIPLEEYEELFSAQRVPNVEPPETGVLSLIDGLLLVRARADYSGGSLRVKVLNKLGGFPYWALLTPNEAQIVFGDTEPGTWDAASANLAVYPMGGEHVFELRDVLKIRPRISNQMDTGYI